jgi:hypothetical protein
MELLVDVPKSRYLGDSVIAIGGRALKKSPD